MTVLLDDVGVDALAGEQLDREPVGVVEHRQEQMVGLISALPASWALFWAPTTTLRARGVNRPKPAFGIEGVGVVGVLGTNRFCAACLVTPMHLPISVHDAPERRAWSTKWPMR